MSQRLRTYDTDLITLRRVNALNPNTNLQFSTGFILTSLSRGTTEFINPLVSLSTVGWVQLPAKISTLTNDLLSTAFYFNALFFSSPSFTMMSSITGLGSSEYVSTSKLTETVLNLERNIFGRVIPSTVRGLEVSGYVRTPSLRSTVQHLGTEGYVSSLSLVSTVDGLSRFGFVLRTDLFSTVSGLPVAGYIRIQDALSTTAHLGSIGYVSSIELKQSLTSTFAGLGNTYVSTAHLVSSVVGMGSLGYVSTIFTMYRSTFGNRLGSDASLFNNISPEETHAVVSFDIGNRLRERVNVSRSKVDIEVTHNSQLGFFDNTSGAYGLSSILVAGDVYDKEKIVSLNTFAFLIQNDNLINIPFVFQERSKFLVSDERSLQLIKTNNTLTLFHSLGENVPVRTQLVFSPILSTAVHLILDNIPSL